MSDDPRSPRPMSGAEALAAVESLETTSDDRELLRLLAEWDDGSRSHDRSRFHGHNPKRK